MPELPEKAFEVGDPVRCIDNHGMECHFTKGKVYAVWEYMETTRDGGWGGWLIQIDRDDKYGRYWAYERRFTKA